MMPVIFILLKEYSIDAKKYIINDTVIYKLEK